MINVRRSQQRGKADHGWLKSHHTFSFAQYHDPKFMGLSDLRVINDDWVEGGAGFGTHPHRNMEIISYVLEGSIAHKDSMGTQSILRAGEVQVMSAGSGIAHSEYNASPIEPVKFLQIWIVPNQTGGQPNYAQRDFSGATGVTLIVSADGGDGSLPIKQDANVYQVKLLSESASVRAASDRVYYLQVARGELAINGVALSAGDGASIAGEERLELTASGDVEALLFELRAA